MNYRLIPEPDPIHAAFTTKFLLSYNDFCAYNKDWIGSLPFEFTEEQYNSSYMWERVGADFEEVAFAQALEQLRSRSGEVIFISESQEHPFAQPLENIKGFAAAADVRELADRIEYEWFTQYEMWENDCIFTDAVLPSELYIFDDTLSWCIIFTHETDDSETAESRYCLSYGLNLTE